MKSKIVLLQKLRAKGAGWAYLVDQVQTVTHPGFENEMIYQFMSVLEEIKDRYETPGEELVVISQSLISMIESDVRDMYPEITFMKLSDANLSHAFRSAFDVPSYKKKNHKTTLFVGSDASGGHMETISAWAWVTSGAEANYSMGVCQFRDINISEFEGMLRAVVENQNTGHARIHVYSDSTSAVEMFKRAIFMGLTEPATVDNYLADLVSEVRKISMVKKLSVEWVRGHRGHRLNQAADVFSRHARKSAQSGKSIRATQAEADAMFEMFKR